MFNNERISPDDIAAKVCDAHDDPGSLCLSPSLSGVHEKLAGHSMPSRSPVHTIPVKKSYYLAFAGLGVPGSENTKRSKRPVLSHGRRRPRKRRSSA
jgi:hypothetical protein